MFIHENKNSLKPRKKSEFSGRRKINKCGKKLLL